MSLTESKMQSLDKPRDSKTVYVGHLLEGRMPHSDLISAAFVMFHCEVSFENACKYLDTLEEKIKSNPEYKRVK